MGTNVQLSSPLCFDRNSVTVGIGFKSVGLGDYLQRPSNNKLVLSDSGIQLDLFHEDDDLTDVNSYYMVEPKEKTDLASMSPSYKDSSSSEVKNESPSSSHSHEALGMHEKGLESSSLDSPDCPAKGAVAHRSKGRPSKMSSGGLGSSSSSTTVRGIIQCPVCSKMFNNSSALAKHKLIHSDERKYSCSLCSKAFKRQDHLNGHMMTHSSKKPYECKFLNCDKSYCDQRSLRRHIENHHQQYLDATPPPTSASEAALLSGRMSASSGENVFQFDGNFLSKLSAGVDPSCSSLLTSPVPALGGVSPTSASQKTAWPFGYNPLDEPKPVQCSMCDRRFKNLPALNGHMRLHGGFVKKDLTESENRKEDLNSSKPGADEVRDPDSETSHCDWPPSSTSIEKMNINLLPKSFCLKQEDVASDSCYDLSDEMGKSISGFSDYLQSSREFERQDEDYKPNFFVDAQLLASETLPQMEGLKLKDSIDQLSLENEAKQFLADNLLDGSNITDDCQLNHQQSANDQQHSACADLKFGSVDSQPGCLQMETSENPGTVRDQHSDATFSRYQMVSCGSVGFAPKVPPGGGSSLPCSSPNASSHLLRRTLLHNKMRKTVTRPLTPSCGMQHGYGSAIHCSGSNAFCNSSTPCTPHSPFAGRAVYPSTHNQSQASSNSTHFEFPPQASPLNHLPTPIHPGYGLSQQQTPHTPLSPYTPQPNAPYTPKNPTSSSRLSRFQFPPASGLLDSGTCESPYALHHQKSGGYHPYNNHHTSLSSPHYTQLHQQQQQQQLKSQNFELDVMQMDKEIEQRLQQLFQEDAKKKKMQNSGMGLFSQPPLNSDLCSQQRPRNESERKASMAPRGRPSQLMLGKLASCQDEDLSLKNLYQGGVFVEEKLDQVTGEFDMDLGYEAFNMIETNPLDRKQRFSEMSADQNLNDLSHLDDLDMILSEGQFGGGSAEMAIEDLANVDVLNKGTTDHNDTFGTGSIVPSVPSSSVTVAIGADHISSLPKWMGQDGLPRYDVGPSRAKEEVFLNPNQLDGFKKKKRRPGPIIIPPCVNNFQTVMSHHYSPNMVDCLRKNSVPPLHPPPPYTALPMNGPANDDRRSFQMTFGSRTPQSAPTFHCIEARFIRDQTNEVLNREKEIFSWDQNVLDSIIETEMHQFQASSNYTPTVSDGLRAEDEVTPHLQSRNNSAQDELSRFAGVGRSDLQYQEFRGWKLDEMNGLQQNVLDNALR